MAWVRHAPSTTIKDTVAGVDGAVGPRRRRRWGSSATAATFRFWDDAEYGFPAMIGTTRWEPAAIIDGLGENLALCGREQLQALPALPGAAQRLRCDGRRRETHDITPEEIEIFHVSGEAFVELPIWLTTASIMSRTRSLTSSTASRSPRSGFRPARRGRTIRRWSSARRSCL